MKKGGKDSKTVSTEGLCTGNQEHTHSSMYRHTHISQHHGGKQSHSIRGKNTRIKCCVLVVFNLARWQPSNSPVVTLDNFMTLVSAAWDRDQDRHPFQLLPTLHRHTFNWKWICKNWVTFAAIWSIIPSIYFRGIIELFIMLWNHSCGKNIITMVKIFNSYSHTLCQVCIGCCGLSNDLILEINTHTTRQQ